MDEGLSTLLILSAITGGIALYGRRICHPARNRLLAVLCFIIAVILTPPAAAGAAYLLYLYLDGIGIIWAVGVFGVLSWGNCWLLRRILKRPPRLARKAVGRTVESLATGVERAEILYQVM